MYKLYEIPAKIETIGEMLVDPETGEILTEEEAQKLINALTEEKNRKIEYLCKLYKNYNAEAEILKKHKQEIEKKQKNAENKASSIQRLIASLLNGDKFKSDDMTVSVSYRTTKNTVIIDDVYALPSDCFKNPRVESNVAKTKIKEMINAGIKIAGAHLEDTISTIIK